jgi:hypothetical protein
VEFADDLVLLDKEGILIGMERYDGMEIIMEEHKAMRV